MNIEEKRGISMGELYEDIYFGDTNKRYDELASMSPEKGRMKGNGELFCDQS